jgi:hypothetical protein
VRQVVLEIGLATADESGLAVEALEPCCAEMRMPRPGKAASQAGNRPLQQLAPSPVPRAEAAVSTRPIEGSAYFTPGSTMRA